jgi:nucleoside-diphosphate-sugar epimerase
MRDFVTGGTGFVGSNVMRSLLPQKYKVTNLKIPDFYN